MKEIEEIWMTYDVDDNGTLDKDETMAFLEDFMAQHSDNKFNTNNFDNVFKLIDKGGNGVIDRDELKDFIKKLKAVEKSKTFSLKNDKKGSKKQQEKEKAFAEKMRLRKEKQPQKKKRSSDRNESPNIFPVSNNRTMDPLNSISQQTLEDEDPKKKGSNSKMAMFMENAKKIKA